MYTFQLPSKQKCTISRDFCKEVKSVKIIFDDKFFCKILPDEFCQTTVVLKDIARQKLSWKLELLTAKFNLIFFIYNVRINCTIFSIKYFRLRKTFIDISWLKFSHFSSMQCLECNLCYLIKAVLEVLYGF